MNSWGIMSNSLVGEEDVSEFKPSLDLYGFLVTGFEKVWINDDSLIKGAFGEALSFTAADLNLYLSANLTKTISMLAEIKFTL